MAMKTEKSNNSGAPEGADQPLVSVKQFLDMKAVIWLR